MTEGPLVSIVVPTLDGRRFISSALASLQRQNHAAIEIIVVDDGSSDGTADIVTQLASEDARIVLLRAGFGSIAASRNTGLQQAKGEFIGFLDHDDLCPDGKIARQVAFLETETGASALFGKTIIFASDATDASSAMDSGQDPTFTMCLSAALFRRNVFDRVGYLDPRFKLADDFDFILRLIEAGLIVLTEDHLATFHRRHASQATADLAATRREATLALAESLKRRRAGGELQHIRHPLLTSLSP